MGAQRAPAGGIIVRDQYGSLLRTSADVMLTVCSTWHLSGCVRFIICAYDMHACIGTYRWEDLAATWPILSGDGVKLKRMDSVPIHGSTKIQYRDDCSQPFAMCAKLVHTGSRGIPLKTLYNPRTSNACCRHHTQPTVNGRKNVWAVRARSQPSRRVKTERARLKAGERLIDVRTRGPAVKFTSTQLVQH